MKNKIANALVSLIKEECPPARCFPLDGKTLLAIAKKNKALPSLFHFLNCSVCQKKLSKKTLTKLKAQQKANLFLNLWYENKKRELDRILKRKKMKGIFLKDFSSYHKMGHRQPYFWGADVDILIDKERLAKVKSLFLKEGYFVRKKLSYEITLVKPKLPVEFDLHFLICEPQKNEFNFLDRRMIRQFSQELLDNSRLDKNGYYRPNKEYFLLSLIMRYWTNDVLKGLRSLFDIIEFANLYDKKIGWKRFLNLAEKFKLKNFSLFVFLLGSHIFDFPFPQELKKLIKIPARVSYSLPYCSPGKIAFFPKNGNWGQTEEGKKILREHFFLQLIVNEKVPFLRLIRPRIILFLLKTGLGH